MTFALSRLAKGTLIIDNIYLPKVYIIYALIPRFRLHFHVLVLKFLHDLLGSNICARAGHVRVCIVHSSFVPESPTAHKPY